MTRLRRFMPAIMLACIVACLLAGPHTAFADEPAPAPEPAPATDPAPAPAVVIPPTPTAEPAAAPAQPHREIKIHVPGERSRNNKLMCGGLLAAGVIGSALGVYWHLDSRDASNSVSADEFTGKAWTDDQVSLVDRAERSKSRAIVAYSIGGAFLVGAIVTWIATEPKSETAIIRTGVVVTPTEHGGTVVGKMWSF